MDNFSPPWAAYLALMDFPLVALDKILVVCLMGVRETPRWDLVKLFMRAAGDKAKMVCGNLQLCAGIADDIE